MPSPLKQQVRSLGGGSKGGSPSPPILWALRLFAVLSFAAVALLLLLMLRVGFDDGHAAPIPSTVETSTTTTAATTNKGGQSSSSSSTDPPVTIAYAISLVKCGDRQSNAAGLVDAALVLRHSVHLTSVRNYEQSGSKYDYKMYAIVHEDAISCSQVLQDVGFELVVVPKPIDESEIRGDYLRKNIHREWCCGIDEFVKLYAYSKVGTTEPIIVHVDIDFVFLKPMDDLFDAMLYDKDTPQGRLARSRIQLELRANKSTDPWPDKIGAFITRDWAQVNPGRKPLFQAGFLVARRDPTITEETFNIIREGNYTGGWTYWNGWGALGYGAFVGAMAMQGLMAYYYDHVRPNTAVELNQCRYNHMGMNVLFEYAPNFSRPKDPKRGKCRNNLEYCEDCRKTALDDIYNVHFTQCRKPWNCIGVGAPGGTTPEAEAKGIKMDAIDTHSGNFGTYISSLNGLIH